MEDLTAIYEIDGSNDGNEQRHDDDDYMQLAKPEGNNVLFAA